MDSVQFRALLEWALLVAGRKLAVQLVRVQARACYLQQEGLYWCFVVGAVAEVKTERVQTTLEVGLETVVVLES
jgi:hypothetical protein